MLTNIERGIKMSLSCIVNKNYVSKSKELKLVQKQSRKYYQERLFERAKNAPRTKIRKLASLGNVEGVIVSDVEIPKTNQIIVNREELLGLIKNSGLTGRSGNGFSVYEKLSLLKGDNTVLIINGVECDPGLVTDSWLYKNKTSEIKSGAQIIKNTFGFDRVILATKEPLHKVSGIEQIKVPDRFPLGYEKYLIKHILGISIRENELPVEKGILVMNLQTVIAINEILKNIEASQYKYITVGNLNTGKAKVARVKIGDCVEVVYKACFPESPVKINAYYEGGGALNCSLVSGSRRVDEKTCYIATAKPIIFNETSSCMRCGKCTTNCPAGVLVHKAIKANGYKEAKNFNVDSCIGCGACTYGCKAGIDVRGVMSCLKKEK